jgi:leader peptidase (prepilin peptidase)/N-methyltransferase
LHRPAERAHSRRQAVEVDDRPDPDLLMTEASASVTPQPATADKKGAAAPRASRPLRELLPRGARAALVLAVSAALVSADFAQFGVTGWAFIGLVLCPMLVLLTAIDLEHRLLPNAIVVPTALAVVAVVAIGQPHHLVTHLVAGVVLGGFFFASAMFFPGSIGMGDVKLGLLLGLALGSKTLPAVEFSLLGVLVVALGIVVSQGMAARKKAIAFGPFLALGAILGFFLG